MKNKNLSKLRKNPKHFQGYFIREQMIKAIRKFFDQKKFHEVINPILNESLVYEENFHDFSTTWSFLNQNKTYYLPASPEACLKKLLAAGLGNCYAIGKSFRNQEMTDLMHNPEFLMLEWYRENSTYQKIVKDLRELVIYLNTKINHFLKKSPKTLLTYQGQLINLQKEWLIFNLEELFEKYTNENYQQLIDDHNIYQYATKKNYSTTETSFSELYDQIFLNEILPHLPKSDPFLLIGFPQKISPLCKNRSSKPYLANRFEFYLGGMEIANGNDEATNDDKIQNIQKKLAKRKKQNQQIDQDFLTSLKIMQQKKYAGIGLGIDRLAMIFADKINIADVEYFCL